MLKAKSAKKLLDLSSQDWICHCCSAKNDTEAKKCRVCGRLESYANQGYGLPFHGQNSTLFRPSQILTVLEDIHEVDSEKWSALHSACASGNFEIVRDLLSLKAKVEAPTIKSQTPLHLAVYSGSADCVRELLKYKANINAVTAHEKCTPLHIACQKGFTEIAMVLIDHGADVDALNILHRTPLHLAAESGRIDIGKLLLGSGANRHALDTHGWSVRQIAELFNHREFQELMIREGMTEKQVIIKELPTAEWHSNLWFDVTNMHKLRTEEHEEKKRQKQHDDQLLQSLQKSRQDRVIAERRAERAIEIQAYNEKKNLAKEMARQYAEQMEEVQRVIKSQSQTPSSETKQSLKFGNMLTSNFMEVAIRTQRLHSSGVGPGTPKSPSALQSNISYKGTCGTSGSGSRSGSRSGFNSASAASRLSSAGVMAVGGPRTATS